MLQQVAARMKFAYSAAEKDWWVTLTLRTIFMLPIGKYMLFKGGTSLSKGWHIISRFSEDIDLILSRRFFADVKHLPCAACANNQQVKLLRKASRDYIVEPQKAQTGMAAAGFHTRSRSFGLCNMMYRK